MDRPGIRRVSPYPLEENDMQKRPIWIVLVAIAMLAILPALAGQKCKYGTQECLDHMANKMKNSGFVGVELDTDNAEGYAVTRVYPGSPAEAAGIESGDILVALNGIAINKNNEDALMKAHKDWKPGQNFTYTIKRNGSERQASLTLAPPPPDALARGICQHMLEHAHSDNPTPPKQSATRFRYPGRGGG